MNISLRVRACFICKRYVIIHPNNPISQEMENKFMDKHSGHMTQVVTLDEINSEYQHEKPSDYIL
ncbi:hypothetical protein LCGC14_0900580 [marine sediment metagenome]|uniref:Uncharacterized protein n=1 Tax=marine sediment metagenome TaxID=412755 RepID=A0A0F9RFP8_9ZZZZ